MAYIISDITSFDNKRNKVTLDYGEVTFLLYKGECRKLGILSESEKSISMKAGRNHGNAAGCGFGRSVEELMPVSSSHTEDQADILRLDNESADNNTASWTAGKTAQQGVLSEERYRYIMDEILLPRARKRVLYYLKAADKTREQIRRKLREGYYPDEVIEGVFAFLDKYGFADDANYAEQYVEELKHSRSAKEIAQKLAQKGISREQIAEQLQGLDPEDEYAACRRAFNKRYPNGISDTENIGKAYAYLARKGFAYDVIRQVIADMGEDLDNDYT